MRWRPTMSKLISVERVKEIIANVFINVSGTCPLDALNALIHAAIDKEPASDFEKDLLDFKDALRILFTPLSLCDGETLAEYIQENGLTEDVITDVKGIINRMFTTGLVFALHKDYYINNLPKHEPASECQKCKEAEKYNMTTRKFMHFLKELEKNFNRTPTYHELIEKNKELEQQLTDYFHTSSHKIEDKRIKELEDKVRNLQHGIDNKVMVVGQKELVDRIKELEGLLREADREVEYISKDDDLFSDNYRKKAKELHNKIKQALGDL
jgi:hypothetical protein